MNYNLEIGTRVQVSQNGITYDGTVVSKLQTRSSGNKIVVHFNRGSFGLTGLVFGAKNGKLVANTTPALQGFEITKVYQEWPETR